MLKATFLGHACFLLEGGDKRVIIDPFLTGNPLAAMTADMLPAISMICVTHGHGDHLGDGTMLSMRDQAPVVATYELANTLMQEGATVVPMNIGGTYRTSWAAFKLVQAWHSSSYQTADGFLYTGMPGGFIIKMMGKTVYHLGDTGLFSDLELIARMNGPIDAALVPIGDHFTMGIADAIEACRMMRPRLTIPMHYNTFPPIKQDPQEFAAGMALAGLKTAILNPGESLTLD